MLKLCNARVIYGGQVHDGLTVLIDGEKIVGIGSQIDADCPSLDLDGKYLSAGWIDLHSHGGGGSDFLDNTVEAFLTAAKLHLAHGTTSMLPTACASTPEETVGFIRAFKAAKETDIGSFFVGVHLEGPYFAASQRGAQDPNYLRTPKPDEYLSVLQLSKDILRWSIAPELDGALELGDELSKRGILASVAHSDATFDEALEAVGHGYTHITHFYSGTSTVTRQNGYRVAGINEAAYLLDDITVEIIADGSHLPPALLKLIYKIKGPDKIALVTDSMRGAGMPEGGTILGSLTNGRHCIIENGVAKLPDRQSFAGSVATADRLIRTMVDHADVPLPQAVKMLTETPASIQGLDKGFLKPGADADIVVFDENVNVAYTILQGRIVYQNNRIQNLG